MSEADHNQQPHSSDRDPHDIIVPLEGLEDKTYSLPEPNTDGTSGDKHNDDWVITQETADEEGNLYVDLARYTEDGHVEKRAGLPVDIFEDYQVKVDAEFRHREAKNDLGASAIRMQLIGMVRNIRDEEYRDGIVPEEQAERTESKERLEAARKESLDRIKGYRDAKRRVNPLKYLNVGKHHPRRPRNDSSSTE